jgi:hypothetical protein
MGYMRKLLGLESLGAPERLELVARLLLDVRDALAGQRAKLHIPPSRASIAARYRPGGEAGSSGYPFHVWEATLYSLQEEGEQRGDRGMLEQQRRASNSALWNEWSDVMREFILTAAQVRAHAGAATPAAAVTIPCCTTVALLQQQLNNTTILVALHSTNEHVGLAAACCCICRGVRCPVSLWSMLLLLQALFEVGRASVKTHRQHLLDISDSAEPDSNDEAAAEQLPANVAGPSNAPGAQVQREQHPAVVQPCMIVDAMLLAPHAARPRQVRRELATAWVHPVQRCVCASADRELEPWRSDQ